MAVTKDEGANMTRDTSKKPEKEAKKDEDKKDGDIKEELVCIGRCIV